tara:strand:+ start:31 stop:993 length:963 start_codon:yes stop_codon:yes gene_type:complete
MDFKKIIRINLLVLLILTTITQAQSNLVFEQALYVSIDPGTPALVPSGKIWKIESTSAVELVIDNYNWIVRDHNGTGGMPIWLPEGKTITATTGNQWMSVLQFSLVPISSTSNNSTAANAFGNVIPSTDSSSSTPSIFNSPKVFTAEGIWVVPPGVTNIFVEVWGKGGRGGNHVGNEGYSGVYAGGGGGGAYAYGSFTVNEGDILNIIFNENNVSVGNLVSAGNGGNGGDATNIDGVLTAGDDGIGGTSTAAFNISGENGENGRGGKSLNGGDGGRRADGNAWGAGDGEFPGGGGGGARIYGSNYRTGGEGGGGQVKIYF